MHLPPAAIIQNCYVVRDLEEACARFHDRFGIGPFVGGTDSFELGTHRYRGRDAEPVRIRGVMAQSGPLNIELVQVVSKGPSAFHDLFPDGGEGLHHVAMFCDDYARERDAWVAAGYPVASECDLILGATICYIDASRDLGHMIELYPENAVIRTMYRQVEAARESWDGRDLILPWP